MVYAKFSLGVYTMPLTLSAKYTSCSKNNHLILKRDHFKFVLCSIFSLLGKVMKAEHSYVSNSHTLPFRALIP